MLLLCSLHFALPLASSPLFSDLDEFEDRENKKKPEKFVRQKYRHPDGILSIRHTGFISYVTIAKGRTHLYFIVFTPRSNKITLMTGIGILDLQKYWCLYFQTDSNWDLNHVLIICFYLAM